MPIVNLTDRNDPQKIDPMAHFHVLAAMLAPRDKESRERILDSCRRDVGDPMRRRGALDAVDSEYAWARGERWGSAAGFVLGALAQLHFIHDVKQPTLNMAFELYRAQLEDHPADTLRENVDYASEADFHPRSNGTLYGLYEEFGPVAHLWAATLFAKQQWGPNGYQGQVIPVAGIKSRTAADDSAIAIPMSIALLPEFLGYAAAFQELYERIPKIGNRGAPLAIRRPWTFNFPKQLVVTPRIGILPIPDDQLNHITRFARRK